MTYQAIISSEIYTDACKDQCRKPSTKKTWANVDELEEEDFFMIYKQAFSMSIMIHKNKNIFLQH